MKNYIKYIVTVFMMIAVMLSTFGITFHNHICGKTGITNTNVIKDVGCACEESHETTCSSEQTTLEDNCCADKTNTPTNVTIKSPDCCVEYIETKEINDSFIAKSFQNIVTEEIPVDFISETLYDNISEDIDFERIYCSLKQKFRNTQLIIIKFINLLSSLDTESSPQKTY